MIPEILSPIIFSKIGPLTAYPSLKWSKTTMRARFCSPSRACWFVLPAVHSSGRRWKAGAVPSDRRRKNTGDRRCLTSDRNRGSTCHRGISTDGRTGNCRSWIKRLRREVSDVAGDSSAYVQLRTITKAPNTVGAESGVVPAAVTRRQ